MDTQGRGADHRQTKQSVIPGYCTQYPEIGGTSDTIDLVIGLDFGTAYTKVVIAETRIAYAVPFAGLAHKDHPFLLPGSLTVAPDGRVVLGLHKSGKQYTDLKMRILNGDTGDETLTVVIAFLALTLQQARSWFFTTHRKIYERHDIHWNVNIGLPTRHYHDSELKDFYNQIVRAAWHASTSQSPISVGSIEGSFADDGGLLNADDIGTFPEFAAQMNGYVRSPMRRSGLHLLVDVGAGTVDVAMFNVAKRDDEDLFPIFAGRVERYGVRVLHNHRVCSAKPSDSVQAAYVENTADVDVAESLGVTSDQLARIDKPFRDDVIHQVRTAGGDAKSKDPLSKQWTDGLPFFLCGGGARTEFYSDLAKGLKRARIPAPLEELHLPRPDRLMGAELTTSDYDRLSVAYGLSFDQFDIGIVVPRTKINDANTSVAEKELCKACAGTGGSMANSCAKCGGSGWIR